MPKQKSDDPLRERPRNKYSDIFEAAFTEYYDGDFYFRRKGDFIQLTMLCKMYKSNLDLVDWSHAVANYFKSPRQSYTLAHLCTNYAAFKRSPADRFGKPVMDKGNGNGNYRESLKYFEDRAGIGAGDGDTTIPTDEDDAAVLH